MPASCEKTTLNLHMVFKHFMTQFQVYLSYYFKSTTIEVSDFNRFIICIGLWHAKQWIIMLPKCRRDLSTERYKCVCAHFNNLRNIILVTLSSINLNAVPQNKTVSFNSQILDLLLFRCQNEGWGGWDTNQSQTRTAVLKTHTCHKIARRKEKSFPLQHHHGNRAGLHSFSFMLLVH